MDISQKVQNITFVYCPAHEGIEENELADSLPKTALKKAKHLFFLSNNLIYIVQTKSIHLYIKLPIQHW